MVVSRTVKEQFDAPTVHFYELFGKGQADAATYLGQAVVSPIEKCEDAFAVFGRNQFAVVEYGERKLRSLCFLLYPNADDMAAIFDGVAYEIATYLDESVRIHVSGHLCRTLERQVDPSAGNFGTEIRQHIPNDIADVLFHEVQMERIPFDGAYAKLLRAKQEQPIHIR